jgi:hypothetical protein
VARVGRRKVILHHLFNRFHCVDQRLSDNNVRGARIVEGLRYKWSFVVAAEIDVFGHATFVDFTGAISYSD